MAQPPGRVWGTQSRWQKGQSGNPSGRVKIPPDVKEMARGLTKEAIATLAAVMRDGSAPHSARVRSAEVILDRAWGRPETTSNVRVSSDVRDLTTAEILAALASLGIAAAEERGDEPGSIH
jgi:Family of unknown function (DUF5681)